jgi:proteasome lid subunit RPN8/RPN11
MKAGTASPPAMDVTPWTSRVVVAPAVLAALEAHACDAYAQGEEACGYLAGPAHEPLLCDELVRMENLANRLHALDPATYFRTGREYFAFHAKRFDDAVRKGAASGRPVKVLYHSHLDCGAYWSPTDAAVLSQGEPPEREGEPGKLGPGPAWPLAFWVASVRATGVDDHRLFAWTGSAFVEAPWVRG